MNVSIQSPDVKLSPKTRDNIREKILSGFSKFQYYVDRVEVHIKDMNGPKGGDDKQCTLKLKGWNDEPVVVSGNAKTIAHGVSSCITRAKTVVSKNLKMKKNSRSRHSHVPNSEA